MNFEMQQGEEVRIADKLPLKLVITDESTVLFTLLQGGLAKHDLTAMVVEHPDLTQMLIDSFEVHWEKSVTLVEFVESRNLNIPVG